MTAVERRIAERPILQSPIALFTALSADFHREPLSEHCRLK
jgi:hypothetical protein